MKRKIFRFGGNKKSYSVCITLPKQIIDFLGYKVGDEFEIKPSGKSLVLSPVQVNSGEESR